MKWLLMICAVVMALALGNHAHAKNAPINCFIQTYNGRYLTAVGGGGRTTDVMHSDATKALSWEKFTLVDADLGTPNITYWIRTKTGHYLTAIDGGGRITNVISLGIVLNELFQSAEDKESHRPLQRILDKCTRPNPDDRIQTAQELARLLEGYAELQRIADRLPEESVYSRWATRFPTISLTLAILLPQIVGTVINIAYNAMRIVSNLSDPQQRTFHTLLYLLNPIVYGVCIATLVSLLFPLFRFAFSSFHPPTQDASCSALRKKVLTAPLWIAGITTLGWLSAAIMFPLLIHLHSGPLPPGILGHFLISFSLSWLVAMTYSFLTAQYFGLRVLYPRLWENTSQIQKTAYRELSSYLPRARFLPFFAGFIPLVAASLMVIVGPESLRSSSYEIYRFLLSIFLVMAMLGLAYALFATRQLSEIFSVFTGRA